MWKISREKWPFIDKALQFYSSSYLQHNMEAESLYNKNKIQ